MSKKWVYSFNSKRTEGNRTMRDVLGGKGANLAEMSALGLPVPPGLTISAEACLDFYKHNKQISSEIKNQVLTAINEIENLLGKKLGDNNNPLLFSVRSGARVSLPGMMDTVLNLGLNDEAVLGLAKLTGNERFAWDSYRRFIQMYADVVMGLNTSVLEATLEDLKEARHAQNDTDLSAADLKELVRVFKSLLLSEFGVTFPQDPFEQLWRAIGAVFNSWNNARAIKYRELQGYSHEWGTGVNVQSMVFGNMGDDCATGVCFTRDPSTGQKKFFGEYLINAQGEDVVAGIRNPAPINAYSKNDSNKQFKSLEDHMPTAYQELVKLYQKLEAHYKDMQDIEFTIEKNKLYLLQTRNGKRTTAAALKIVVDLVNEGLITKEEAILRISPEDLNQLLHPRLDPNATKKVIGLGLSASPGAASGKIMFDSEAAHQAAEAGEKVLLVRQETSPEDIGGMIAAQGILTARGGMTSHAAVVARGMGKPCVAGCSSMVIDYNQKKMTIGGKNFLEGDFLTIDGGTGEIFDGLIPTIQAEIGKDFGVFMNWADGARKLKVRTNADNPEDAKIAREFGAQGIGLCRTEHMFFQTERILAIREMIFADTVELRKKALAKLLPYQKEDFIGIFREMYDLPVNIRLLDPPLHEFLPHTQLEKEELSKGLKVSLAVVENRCNALHEFNPMLGHRGCRLGVTYPEIYRMQVRAIFEAAIIVFKNGIKVTPEVMIPLIASAEELEIIKVELIEEIEQVFKEQNQKIEYKMGTMIELPRAAITAAQIAPHADFFSFGTNDLTQTTYGLSRDDSGKFLPEYVHRKLFAKDPFVALDRDGVGFLVNFAVKEGRKANSKIHMGICGEHGGEPSSVEFCHEIGLDYVSCSPFRVPIARLAAAQANLKNP